MTDSCRPTISPSDIEAALAQLLASTEPELQLRRDVGRDHHALPLLLDMGGCFALRPSGEMIVIAWEAPHDTRPLTNPRDCHYARAVGSKKYPEIAGLAPVRTSQSVTCSMCNGTGIIRPDLNGVIVCSCGGLGWLPETAA
jgi:hypothetical protein